MSSTTISTMPPANAMGSDTPVSLKINYEGGVSRSRLLLREVGVDFLENKLREILSIPTETQILIERFSDSAGNFLVLDSQNVSVYKQLYRAAKAKQKLKLRVTIKKPEVQVDHSPRPVTVEDVPEIQAPAAVAQPATPTPAPAPIVAPIPTTKPFAHRHRTPQSSSVVRNVSATVRAQFAQTDVNNVPVTHTSSVATSSVRTIAAPTPRKLGGRQFAVCCNNCDRRIPDMHHHCSICDGGDFDLCQECVDKGVTCKGADHWLIKRFVDQDKQLVTSITEKPLPKPRATAATQATMPMDPTCLQTIGSMTSTLGGVRTCNSCVREMPDVSFVHCKDCEDFDLCMHCFTTRRHGHDPRHAFKAVIERTDISPDLLKMFAPGRHAKHHAICDGCDKYIYGIRHKCTDCPDWDYCSECFATATLTHAEHRFVPVYEQDNKAFVTKTQGQMHYGIVCDGPLCKSKSAMSTHIVGDRYKCAVCNDTDFCAGCEASPSNQHNKSHPLIKFKTPVRHVTVSTQGEYDGGRPMPSMGDVALPVRSTTVTPRDSDATLAQPSSAVTASAESAKVEAIKAEEFKPTEKEGPKAPSPAPVVQKAKNPVDQELVAVFVRDAIVDGTKLQSDQIFQQTWVMRNEGTTTWPAGCAVRFVGGDYMGYADSNRPAGVRDLISAGESTRCYYPLAPGQQFAFTVLLRAPIRSGPAISYWRLTTADNIKFGHRLWCEISVQTRKVTEPKKEVVKQVEEPAVIFKEASKEIKVETAPIAESMSAPVETGSQMIFPKLDKESPVSSIHQEAEVAAPVAESKEESEEEQDDFDDVAAEEAEWQESQDGFMTDEEYDILDASDEEYLQEQSELARKK